MPVVKPTIQRPLPKDPWDAVRAKPPAPSVEAQAQYLENLEAERLEAQRQKKRRVDVPQDPPADSSGGRVSKESISEMDSFLASH